ncbi:MAG TPA: hypothetical protein VEF06_11290 [Bryobacteraceae bacterium]|nr:hypothetical protein [Bryobacteraceae bacterium]
MLDLRVPSGWYFVIVGALLAGMGLVRPANPNVNLAAGAAMLAFGLCLLILAWRRRR